MKIILSAKFLTQFSFLRLTIQTCQRDIKRLRERELSLQGDLSAASKEILRLRELLQEFTASAGNGTIVTNTTTML